MDNQYCESQNVQKNGSKRIVPGKAVISVAKKTARSRPLPSGIQSWRIN
jgi:hypothetical protein